MRSLVLDFDGTMTLAEEEGAPFREGYLADLCALVGRKAQDAEVVAIADAVDKELAEAPEQHPFLWGGRAVAPATVDPYLRMATIAHRVFDAFSVMPSHVERGRLFGSVLYKHNYKATLERPVFRPGAGRCLKKLANHLKKQPVFIVTNSDTEAVAGKITKLGKKHKEVKRLRSRVYGQARKFEVEDEWDAVPATLEVPGLARPVLLRRRHYHDLLAKVLARAESTFSELTVVGDIFELDLALPLALGARVALVRGPRTPEYELAYVAGHERGKVLEDLREVEAFAFG